MAYTFSVGINSFFRYNEFQPEFELKYKRLSKVKVKQIELNQKILDGILSSNTFEIKDSDYFNHGRDGYKCKKTILNSQEKCLKRCEELLK